MQNSAKLMAIGPAAKHLGVSRDTLRRWEKSGKIKSVRTPTNRRLYSTTLLNSIAEGKSNNKKVTSEKEDLKPQTVLVTQSTISINPIFLGIISFFITIAIGFLVISSFFS